MHFPVFKRAFAKMLAIHPKRWYDKSGEKNAKRIVKKREGRITMTHTVYSIVDVANWFLSKETMNHKKLQKLCYYAQAWGLVFTGKKIIDGDFEAWVHGPVNSKLWNYLKGYGYLDVEKQHFKKSAKEITDPQVISVLNDVWETYGEYSGFQLELLTHSEDPWIKARGDLPSNAPSHNKIDNSVIMKFYSSKICDNV